MSTLLVLCVLFGAYGTAASVIALSCFPGAVLVSGLHARRCRDGARRILDDAVNTA